MSKPNAAALAALRQRFNTLKEGKKEKSSKFGEYYPFWDIKQDETARIRILRDANKDNENFFFVDKLEHVLDINGKAKKIACITMFGEKCPICELSQKYYKANDKVLGKQYYRKKQSLLRALVLKDPLPPGEDGETALGKVKTLQFGYQLMQKIMEQISNEDEPMEFEPWDLENGYNFTIKKMAQGEYDNYSVGSSFSGRSSAVPEEYLEACVEVDLRTLLPANPGEDKVHEFLNAHLTGEDLPEENAKPAQAAPAATTAGRSRIAEAAAADEDDAPRTPAKPKPAARPVDEDDDEPVRASSKPAPAAAKVEPEDEPQEATDDEDLLAFVRTRQQGKAK